MMQISADKIEEVKNTLTENKIMFLIVSSDDASTILKFYTQKIFDRAVEILTAKGLL